MAISFWSDLTCNTKFYNSFYYVGSSPYMDEGEYSLMDVFYNPKKAHVIYGSTDTWGNARGYIYLEFVPKDLCDEVLEKISRIIDTEKNKKKIINLLKEIPCDRDETQNGYIYMRDHYTVVAQKLGLDIYSVDSRTVWTTAFPVLLELENITLLTYSERTISFPIPV